MAPWLDSDVLYRLRQIVVIQYERIHHGSLIAVLVPPIDLKHLHVLLVRARHSVFSHKRVNTTGVAAQSLLQ